MAIGAVVEPSTEQTVVGTTEQDFLDEILADPDDDGRRLVYADWLEGIGDPRSEFIRLQVESEKLRMTDPRKCEVDAKADLLFRRHRTEWCRPFRSCASSVRFRRGFVEVASLRGKFRDQVKELFAKAPIRDLCLDGGLAKIMALPELGRLRGLRLRGTTVGESRYRQLFELPQAQSLELLDLHYSHASDTTVRLALKQLPRLRKINLDGTELNTDEFGDLMFSQDAAKIEEIMLPGALNDFVRLLSDGGLPNLRRIGFPLPIFRMILKDSGEGICELPGILNSTRVFLARGQPIPSLAAAHFNKEEREYLNETSSKLSYAEISFSNALGILNDFAESVRSLHTLVLNGWENEKYDQRMLFEESSFPDELRVLCIYGFSRATESLCRFLRSNRASKLVRLRIDLHQTLPESVLEALCESESLTQMKQLVVDADSQSRKRLSKRFGRGVCQYIGASAPRDGFGFPPPWSGHFV